MNSDERIELILRNTAEIVTAESLKELLRKKKKPTVYCGYEPSGPMHLGNFITITKLIDLEKAGFEVIILLADIHALLNRKGNEAEIKKEVENWKKTIKAIGLNAKVVVGSDFEFSKEYVLDVMRLAQQSTINRGLRSIQEVARDIENATISQLWYPLMQVADVKYLGVDCALGGLDQRKVYMLGRDMSDILKYNFVTIYTPMMTSLKGPGQKMSKSLPGSGISITDSYEEIKKTINKAYCPEKEIKDNPVLQIARYIIFPRFDVIEIKRPEKFGGDLKLFNADSLETLYSENKIHPMDLKNTITEYLEQTIAPIRKKYK